MLKFLKLPFILFFLNLSISTNAEDDKRAYYYQQITTGNDKLKTVFENEKVKAIYDDCYERNKLSSTPNKAILDCVWRDLDKPKNSVIRNEILTYLNDGKKVDEEGADQRGNTFLNLSKEDSKTVKALRDFYSKRLEEALYGAPKSGQMTHTQMPDQTDFFKLQKTQLGKNIVATLTSYCIDADHVKTTDKVIYPIIYSDPKEVERVREKNIRNLRKDGELGDEITNAAYADWSGCIANVQHMCHQSKYKEISKDGTEREVDSYTESVIISKVKDTNEKDKEDYLEVTKTRACEVTEYLVRARKSLGLIDKTVEKFGALRTNDTSPIKMFDGKEKGKSIDDLTSLTSKDLVDINEDNSYANANAEDFAEFSECYDMENNEIIDEQKCESYVQVESGETSKALVQMKAEKEKRKELLAALVKKKDLEKLKQVLVNDGYTEEEATKVAQAVIDGESGVDELIKKRYDSRMEALLQSTASRIDAITVKSITNADAGDKLKAIGEKIQGKTKEFAELVHFNNIVSSYLSVTDSEGAKSKNVASARRELNNNIFSEQFEDVRELYETEYGSDGKLNSFGSSANQQRDLKEVIGETLDLESGGDSNNAVLNVDDINQNLLNLEVNKKEEEATP